MFVFFWLSDHLSYADVNGCITAILIPNVTAYTDANIINAFKNPNEFEWVVLKQTILFPSASGIISKLNS